MSDSLAMIDRSLRLSVRNVDALITSLALPVLMMLIFVFLFGGAVNTGGGGAYVQYVVPGVLVLCAGFGAGNTAIRVTQDMTGGIIDRFRSLDVSPTAILVGHVTASLARNLAASALVFGVATAIGFRSQATFPGLLAAAAVLLAFILAISWVGAAVGLLAKSPEAASGFTFFIAFLPYPSSGFVPVQTMPSWIHGFAENQPITPVIEALRGLLLDQPVGAAPWLALAWCAGIVAVGMTASATMFRRRTS
ncbi:ABC transporter permease [Sphaerisporangium sp. TRM90804]|uniref:ABC transporter permease n=1 Tax=Sphaerisporangium sp. TRM90804 TaxID=3031113 RepID=UPI002446A7FB|nr:ABC transporter permease [Sphaerisporangium sp. TRM90804]MDH2425893.1 ABC transporter permease [Sphaerisporangium sp. TRM90804]